MNQTGHRSVQMVRRYIRDASSAGKLGCNSTSLRTAAASLQSPGIWASNM